MHVCLCVDMWHICALVSVKPQVGTGCLPLLGPLNSCPVYPSPFSCLLPSYNAQTLISASYVHMVWGHPPDIGQVSHSPQLLHLSVWDRQALSLNMEPVDRLDWLARELPDVSVSILPTSIATPTPPAFPWASGIHIRTSWSHSKHLTHWATQAPEIWISFLQ